MKHWRMEQVAWDGFDPARVDPAVVPLVKAAALVERNAADYVTYLGNVFADDPDFRQATANWGAEETQHGDALGRWAALADPGWDFPTAFARFRAGYRLPLEADSSVRGSRTGELIARCIVETGTSSYYSALGESACEPVLKQVCALIAADEFRHFKLFYDHMKRYLARERIGVLRRLRVAFGRLGETEDDELAFAFHVANMPAAAPYRHDLAAAAYMGTAIGFYRFHHIARITSMVLKAVGLPPQGRLSGLAAKASYRLLQRKRARLLRLLAAAGASPSLPPLARAA